MAQATAQVKAAHAAVRHLVRTTEEELEQAEKDGDGSMTARSCTSRYTSFQLAE